MNTMDELGVWVQTIGQIQELLGLAEALYEQRRDEDRLNNKTLRLKRGRMVTDGAEKALIGVWIQSIGQVLEAIGVTKQLSPHQKISIQGRQLSIQGNWLQAYGSALEAIGGAQELAEFKKGLQDEWLTI